MSDNHPATAVIFEGAPPPDKPPRPTPWDWIKYYAYNLSRKPLVWKKQKRLLDISNQIQAAMKTRLYPQLLKHKDCKDCLDAYMALKPQVFVSQVEFGLRHLRCDLHPDEFVSTYRAYEPLFRESEELSAWINGFSK